MDDLLALTGARWQQSQAILRSIAAREADLRDRLHALTLAQEAARAANNDFSLRALGADLLWHSWVARQREALHTQLANLLVAKAEATAGARTAFGKHQAIKGMCHTASEARRKSRQDLEAIRLLDIVNASAHQA